MFKKNPNLLYTVLAILVVLLVSYFLETFLILPSFNQLTTINSKIDTEKARINSLNLSISNLSGQQSEQIKRLKGFFDILLPEELDSLHFASLNEVVAASSGATVISISISKGVGAAVTPAAGVGQTSQVAPTNVSVTYTSSFASLLSLLRNWVVADRLVGPLTVTISSQSGQLQYTISYELPLAAKVGTATINDNISLSKSEIEQIEKIRKSIIYTATPSANPVGKVDPFK